MFVKVIKSKDIIEQKNIEGALSDIAKQESLIDYVAMMAKIDIPIENEDNGGDKYERFTEQ